MYYSWSIYQNIYLSIYVAINKPQNKVFIDLKR